MMGRRLREAGLAAAYIVIALPLAAVCVALLLAAGLIGVVLSPLVVGFAILNATAAGAWRYAQLERALANRLLRARIPPLPPRRRIEATGWRRITASFRETGSRRAIRLSLIKLPATIAAAAVALAATGLAVAVAWWGIRGLTVPDPPVYVGGARLGIVTGALLLALAVPAAVLAVAVLDSLASGLRRLAYTLLAIAPPPGSPVREMLAESLGDRNLRVAYWLPDRGIFVDERGTPVALPEPGSGRAWTSVDRGGRRVAAIVHDADLDAGPELVQAAAAAAALALDNEQLKADLRARLEELRASRGRIVEAADAARRRLERDLHDGAQQQLVALALDLRLLKARVHGDGDSAALVERANAKLAAALEELRELARGIHPAILSDRGLAPAVQALVRRVAIPIDCDVRIDGRLPDPVEAAAYFVVAEAVTNVVKYADAASVNVRIWQDGDRVELEVVDDGVGGAEASRGSGLRGLADRLGAVDGTIALESPPGQGTRIHASIPTGTGARQPASGARTGAAVIATLALSLLLAACGTTIRGHEPDLAATPPPATTATTAARSADANTPSPRRRVRIAVVTHGQASDPFWAVVRSGIERAAHELGVSVSYTAPDTTDIHRMRQLILDAAASHPAGLVVSIPDARALGPAIRSAVRAGIPVVSINSGGDAAKRLGVLAHVGQPDEQAGYEAGRRMAAEGAVRTLCVKHETGNAGLDARCRGFARAMRKAGGTSSVLSVNLQNRHDAEQKIAAAALTRHVDGMLTLGAGGTLPAIAGLRLDRLLGSVRLATFDLSPEVLAGLRANQVDFAVDQQPFLQGYMPILFLTQYSRYGLIPAQGTILPTGPSFVTRRNADAVEALTKQGIR